ncbi:MAG: c-type cytochrome [Gammaproteobacteria bacterium]|nr:c-type cytochrome [Gammaproteobacteria bacterium]
MRISLRLKAIIFGCLVGVTGVAAAATESRQVVEQEMASAKALVRQMTRGGLVYKTYCVLCHGGQGDGEARITKLHDNLDLKITKRPLDYYQEIIRDGGPAVGRSEFMPTWQDELSEEQIQDVAEYLYAVTDPVRRGEVVFKTNCILCHGVKGDGKGRASALFDPPPANLTRSDKNDDYKRMIITMGGKAMGRSEVMPIWGEQLKANEIDDVVAYLRTILAVAPAN